MVDDSLARVDLVRNRIESRGFDYVNFEAYSSADEGRIALRSHCDVLILDVLIPKKINGTPSASCSISLLREVCNPEGRMLRPRLIVGLTADVNEIAQHQEEYAKYASVVVQERLGSTDWLNSIDSHLSSVYASALKSARQTKSRVLVSVHGIRTYGQWQGELHRKLREWSSDFYDVEIKYGFLDLLSFLVPSRRKEIVERMADRVVKVIEGNPGSKVSIVAHSFGTLICLQALQRIESSSGVDVTIFCGSPLPATQNIDAARKASRIFVNDCGTRDWVLVLARVFGPGLGDAGRVGFWGGNDDRFVNRYFNGGHGLYFEAENDVSFAERNWIGLILGEAEMERVDERKGYFGQDLVEAAISVLGGRWKVNLAFSLILAITAALLLIN